MKFKHSLIFLTFLSLVTFSACKKDKPDDDLNTTCSTAALSATFDGANHTGSGFNNTLLKENNFYFSGRRLDLRASINGGTLILSVENADIQNPPTNGVVVKSYAFDETDPVTFCHEFDEGTYCDGMLGTFMIGGKTYMTIEENYPSKITITSLDANTKTVSGSFDMEVSDFTNTQIIKGTFSNLCYRVLN